MRRYLVVADRTLAGPELERLVRERVAEGPCDFHIVVPAAPPTDRWTSAEDDGIKQARARLDDAIRRFSAPGAIVVGDIGDRRPMDAVADALYGRRFDGVIVSTLPPGRSEWLQMNLPDEVRTRFSLPVIHIEWDPDLAQGTEPAAASRDQRDIPRGAAMT
jgi:GABA permease